MWTTNQEQRVWDGNRDAAKDFGIKTGESMTILEVPDNRNSSGIWSDCTMIWVADERLAGTEVFARNQIFTYNLETKEPVPAKDINTLDFNNTKPSGLWSNETTMWVSVSGGNFLALNLSQSVAMSLSDSGDTRYSWYNWVLVLRLF